MIEQNNVLIVKFRDHKVKGKMIPAKAVRSLEGTKLAGLPIVMRVGAIDYKLGIIHRGRKGREEFFGDLVLEIEGYLEFEPIEDEEGKISSIKPIKFVYQKEKPG